MISTVTLPTGFIDRPGASVGYHVAIMKPGTMTQPKFGFSLLVGTALAVLLSACAPNIVTRGNLPAPELLTQIQPGLQSRNQVADMLGSPSSVATFGEEIWYYISSQTETIAFYEPEITDQQVVAITFDDAGKVKKIRTYGLEDAQEIEPVARITPTGGREITILEQLVGNLGRFTKQGN